MHRVQTSSGTGLVPNLRAAGRCMLPPSYFLRSRTNTAHVSGLRLLKRAGYSATGRSETAEKQGDEAVPADISKHREQIGRGCRTQCNVSGERDSAY